MLLVSNLIIITRVLASNLRVIKKMAVVNNQRMKINLPVNNNNNLDDDNKVATE